MGERKQMTDFYDEKFIKSVRNFDKILDDNWFERLKTVSDQGKLSTEIKWFVNELRIAIKVLFVVAESEMHQTNKIKDIISKLPNDEKYQELKSLFEERDNDIEETIRPLSEYTKELEESRKKRPDYIG